jgi:hypothetical protein
MARIRTVKPELAAHEGMFDLEQETGLPIRFAWCMLFTVADREGRFAWRPRTIKAQTLPHDALDFSRVLDAWLTRGFVEKYRVGDEWFGWIPTFTKHQVINNREAQSDLPSIDAADEVIRNGNKDIDACRTRDLRESDASSTREVHALGEGRKEGKGREGNTSTPTEVGAERFQEFWSAYPNKTARKVCLAKWKARKLDAGADAIIADVKRKASEDRRWLDGFVPNPETYLNQDRWDDPIQPRRATSASDDVEDFMRGAI